MLADKKSAIIHAVIQLSEENLKGKIQGRSSTIFSNINYQLVFRVLYTKDASFGPNQHQQSGHLDEKGKK